jgi:hypothetical protein
MYDLCLDSGWRKKFPEHLLQADFVNWAGVVQTSRKISINVSVDQPLSPGNIRLALRQMKVLADSMPI